MLRTPPLDYGIDRSRWSLGLLSKTASWLNATTAQGVWQVINRLKISYKRGRNYLHSPDAQYEEKFQAICQVLAMHDPSKNRIFFQDEFTYYTHPTRQQAYELQGKIDPKVTLPYSYERTKRLCGTIDAFSGATHVIQRNKIRLATLVGFYQSLCEKNPDKQLYLIQDGWPVHFHPDVLEALQAQQPYLDQFPYKLPKSWEHLKPSGKYKKLNLPIIIVPLPTYSPWLNNIEKLWHKLYREILHHHPFAERFKELNDLIDKWLLKFEEGSGDLLNYVGLLGKNNLYAHSILPVRQKFYTEKSY